MLKTKISFYQCPFFPYMGHYLAQYYFPIANSKSFFLDYFSHVTNFISLLKVHLFLTYNFLLTFQLSIKSSSFTISFCQFYVYFSNVILNHNQDFVKSCFYPSDQFGVLIFDFCFLSFEVWVSFQSPKFIFNRLIFIF